MFKKMNKTRLISLIICMVLSACQQAPDSLRLGLSLQSVDKTKQFSNIIAQHAEIDLHMVAFKKGDQPLDMLVKRQVDLMVIENSAKYREGIAAVLPLYTGVLHILYRSDLKLTTPQDLIKGRTLFLGNSSTVSRKFVETIAKLRGIDEKEYQIVDRLSPGKTDVVFFFSAISPAFKQHNLKGYRLYSMGRPESLGLGSIAEAIQYVFPQMKPFIIPVNTYPGFGNEQAVVTISVDMVLVTHQDISEQVIYRLMQTLVEQKAKLTSLSPSLFFGITDQFEPLKLNFPLHQGTRRYLERDRPSFFERFAEMINMLAYLSVLLLTSGGAFYRWRRQRKKDRIDRFYLRVLAVREQLDELSLLAALQQLKEIENEAFQLLIDEELVADESFQIFLTLLKQTVEDKYNEGTSK
ncbi:MAG: hypothetical protein HRT52_16965 [Colwellia sp.]|nr:hypothetical protein [Colwellia sp.]